MLHDLNSLALVKSSKHPVILVVINNNGGGIFSFLPIAKFRDVFEPYFGTPQDVSFEHAARQFGLEYAAPVTKASFVSEYARACRRGSSTLIEIRTNRTENVALHARLQRRVVSALEARRHR
jgi:2-succinyl-5-enolpyruvyl-6-hydroxy-3-cyclohexene-1-carboxylate synthase